MNQADIECIIGAQGYAPYAQERTRMTGNGTEAKYHTVSAVEGHGRRRKRYYLGTMAKLTQMSEADLVALIAEKTKSAQPAQKGKK